MATDVWYTSTISKSIIYDEHHLLAFKKPKFFVTGLNCFEKISINMIDSGEITRMV